MNRNLYKTEKPGPNVPPLGVKDGCLYLLAMLLCGGLVAVTALVTLGGWEDEVNALVAPGSVAAAARFWAPIAAMGMAVAMGAIALERMERRYPIFGNPDYSYGGEDWDPVYPAMLRDENAPPEVKKAVRQARMGLVLWGLGILVSVLLCVNALVGGTRLYADGTIRTTVAFGEVTAHYTPEQIDRVILKVREPSRGRHSDNLWRLELTFRTEGNEIITFSVHDLTAEGMSEIDVLRQILSCYPTECLRFENGRHVSKVFEWTDYELEEEIYLRKLFTGLLENGES